jgi:DNA polymerase III subunit alpha
VFIHLHAHSHYSFLEALPSPTELAQAAARAQMPALALTDHTMLSGALEFYQACREVGVQPLLGLELDVALPPDLPPLSQTGAAGRLVLLALDLRGWGSLCRLSSAALVEPGTPSALPFEVLAEHADGLLCLTGGHKSSLNRLVAQDSRRAAAAYLERLGELFPGRLYVELHIASAEDEHLAAGLVALAQRLRLPIAAAGDIYYLESGQAELQRVLAGMRLNRPWRSLEAGDLAPSGAYFAAPSEMEQHFNAYPQAVAATLEIAERCSLELPLGETHFPEVHVPPGSTLLDELRRKAEAGAQRIYGRITPFLKARLEHELSVIGECGYAPLFLVMQEVVAFARRDGIPIASRGSAASSLVAHCLGITDPDPMRLNLYFERFLNPARATPPDIDTDLCSRRRDRVIRFVYERFGHERVAMVCTISRFRRRSALREVAKAYGLPPSQVSKLAESLPYRWYGPPERQASGESPFADLEDRYPDALHQAIFRDAAAVIGMPRHLSIHPGGVVISPGLLTDLVPTQMAAKGVRITQFDLEGVERFGLVKMDLLGIRGLTVLGDVAQAVYSGEIAGPLPARKYSTILEVLDAIPADDPLTSELVRQGRTIGCFQIESPGMRATLKEIQAQDADDIMVALALYRPGPLTGGLKDAFVRRHRGLEPPDYLHPRLESLLAETYGVILYQEQVLQIAHELGGLSLSDADLLRRAMSHFDPGKQMVTLKEKFIQGAAARHQVPAAISEQVWELMAAFAGYGFPKAHAASYAQVAWRAAWCKAHYPGRFLAGVLANWGGYFPQSVYLTEARRSGLKIYPPLVNHARREFSTVLLEGEEVLIMGLNQVRELTRRTQERILRQRPFISLQDFLARADPRPVEADNLARCGALQDFGSIPTLLRHLKGGGWRGGQLSLFANAEPLEEDWSIDEKAAAEEAILGVSVSAHPLELKAAQITAAHALTTVDAAARVGEVVRVAGTRQSWRRSRTSQGEYIYFMVFEDLEGMLDVVISEDAYRRSRRDLSQKGPYLLEGTVERHQTRGEPFIRAARIWVLS